MSHGDNMSVNQTKSVDTVVCKSGYYFYALLRSSSPLEKLLHKRIA